MSKKCEQLIWASFFLILTKKIRFSFKLNSVEEAEEEEEENLS